MVIQIDIRGPGGSRPPWLVYVPGAILILLGLMIILLPQLLQFLIGGALIAGGVVLITLPSRLRR